MCYLNVLSGQIFITAGQRSARTYIEVIKSAYKKYCFLGYLIVGFLTKGVGFCTKTGVLRTKVETWRAVSLLCAAT